jgi:hypothetical protein
MRQNVYIVVLKRYSAYLSLTRAGFGVTKLANQQTQTFEIPLGYANEILPLAPELESFFRWELVGYMWNHQGLNPSPCMHLRAVCLYARSSHSLSLRITPTGKSTAYLPHHQANFPSYRHRAQRHVL